MHPDAPRDDDRHEPGGEPCIWMTAGLLAWRLCDRGFDCEHCPLDAALQGSRTVAATPAPGAAAWEFRDDRRYHTSHAWALVLAPDRVRCGLDAFAARLVRHATSVVLGAVDSRVERGQVGAWLIDDAELLPLRAPVSGRIVARNHRVQSDTGLIAREPYDGGWLYEVHCDRVPGAHSGLLTCRQMQEQSAVQWRRLHADVARDLRGPRADLGPTLADGGEPLADLRSVLGGPRYRHLIRTYLG